MNTYTLKEVRQLCWRQEAEAVRPRVGVRRKRSDPATTPARLRNADQERECAPREERKG
ncbi:MAG: hypothetical protein F6K54_32840 [Okeania sp. SIO3B5]|uniref:hypothetical protein n=1 Tax=Okeania sp. SIO3B5 TaxID=2607811 RepID=UPI0013FFD075|nr:hypothetical protein [Okeania sp. SIO3B5]NEO57443.1 hypothetical protein [Okeania sp. SIO3B5]